MVSRIAACPCNSGRRYKHCCGLEDIRGAPETARHERNRNAGLMLQERGDFAGAMEFYDCALADRPDDWDVAHMRATCLYQLAAMDDARAAFADLLATPAADIPGFWTNLGLLLASIGPDHSSVRLQERLQTYRCLRPLRSPPALSPSLRPTVSVVMPAYMHANYVGAAIASVFAQTYTPLEFIVIDDGSRDATVQCCREALAEAPLPVRFIARENRGAAATLNQGIELASGEFIQLLNSDDRLPPQRIETMLAALLAHDAEWGYARVAFVDRDGRALEARTDARVATLMAAQDAAMMSHTLGLALLRANSTISTGNLFLRKRLWATLGGFHDHRYNHDLDFCLRAALVGEPVLVPQTLYEYRIHGLNTITEKCSAAREEQRRVMSTFLTHAHEQPGWPNPFAPTLGIWGGEVLALLGATGMLRAVPRAAVERALRPSSRAQIEE